MSWLHKNFLQRQSIHPIENDFKSFQKKMNT